MNNGVVRNYFGNILLNVYVYFSHDYVSICGMDTSDI